MPCDVSDDEQIRSVFDNLKKHWDGFDILIHSIAYAPRELLDGEYLKNVTREGFLTAHEISSYSFSALANASREMMKDRKGAMLI